MRNPFGIAEWNGDWSDHSYRWTPDLAYSAGFEGKDDSVFFISETDFYNNFECSFVCHYVMSFQHSNI